MDRKSQLCILSMLCLIILLPAALSQAQTSATLAANTFTGDQTVNGNLSATGVVTGSSYQIGNIPFAFGTYSLGNALLGFAGNSTMTGGQNTAGGLQALQGNTTGTGNTAVGVYALQVNTVGSFNTGVGFDANTFQANLSNATAIGARATVDESNALVLGSVKGLNAASASVSVGIGTITPAATLDVIDNGLYANGSGKSATISATSSAVNSAVSGVNNSTSGLANGATFATMSPAGTGVVAINYGTGGNDYAGYFQGNVAVTGTINAKSITGAIFGQSGSESATGSGLETSPYLITTIGNPGVWADGGSTNGNAGIVATSDNGAAGYFANNSMWATLYLQNDSASGYMLQATNTATRKACQITTAGDLNCSGTKNAIVPIYGGKRKVALSAIESPQNWFEDFGSAELKNGAAVVTLDPDFVQTVNTEQDYKVFPVPNGDCKGLYVTHKTATSFEVRELGGGTSSVSFDYRITALRRNYETVRLADHTNDPDPLKMVKNLAQK